jgi:hypothetical protein
MCGRSTAGAPSGNTTGDETKENYKIFFAGNNERHVPAADYRNLA